MTRRVYEFNTFKTQRSFKEANKCIRATFKNTTVSIRADENRIKNEQTENKKEVESQRSNKLQEIKERRRKLG